MASSLSICIHYGTRVCDYSNIEHRSSTSHTLQRGSRHRVRLEQRSSTMLTLRKAEERGRANFGWLDSRHSFSFGHYYDEKHMGFGPLRVINEDRVQPGAGFDTHGHRDM